MSMGKVAKGAVGAAMRVLRAAATSNLSEARSILSEAGSIRPEARSMFPEATRQQRGTMPKRT